HCSFQMLLLIFSVCGCIFLCCLRQEPEVMEVAPGSNVTMKCHYQGNFSAGGEIRVRWKCNISIIATDRVNVTVIQNGSFYLNLTSVRRNESGTYVCEVILEIPILSHMEGKGTVLIVTAAVSDTRKHIFFIALWTALSMAALTVVTGFLICCKYKSMPNLNGKLQYVKNLS
uniref:Ig-like domain-containing protein n=1 Tax=Paramormyrops kingsleyae TaxID=1676925 RepID=A0A3B3QR27_9TELE